MVRDDGGDKLDFDWGLDGPSKDCGVNVDDFSVRWTRIIPFSGSAYQFTITSDDGVRLLVDGKEQFSNWSDHPQMTDRFEIALAPGNHKITLEYYERLGSAIAKFSWAEHPCIANVPPDRWRGEYFNNDNLSGKPGMVRDDGDSSLFFDFREAGPSETCGITQTYYSARWSRQVAFGQGIYRFDAISDGGMRIFVDRQLRLDRWQSGATDSSSFDLFLDPGNHSVVFEYRRKSARSRGGLKWKIVPCHETVPDDHWRGEYFNSDSPSGTPIMVRDDGNGGINFNWGEESPASPCGVRQKGYSVRWTISHIFAGGVYRFFLAGNGGAKLVIDGQTRFDQWHPAPFKTSLEAELTPGSHQLSLEYSNLGGKSNVSLDWEDPPCVATSVPSDHWRGEYFNNMNLSGRPSVVRNEGVRMIDFERGLITPQPDCADFHDEFSVRWSRIATFEAMTYRFEVTADDGARLFLDGKLIIDEWHDQAETTYTKDVEMTAGKHRVVLEYYDHFGSSRAHLTWAAAPCTAIVPAENWRGEYFNNPDLAGKPAMTRDDGNGAINFDWGLKSPESNCGLNADNFSVRWTRTALFGDGPYRFKFTGDDGARVYVDGKLRFNRWVEQMATQVFDIPMTTGNHRITVEYFDHWGSAAIKFSWERHPCFADVPPDHWRGEYFNNPALSGLPVMIRNDGNGGLDFDWGVESPSASCGLNADDFSIRWSRKLIFETGWQRFTVTADDGVRLYIDGRKVIDEWRNQLPATFTVDVNLAAGSHRIVMEYYERTGSATARLNWQGVPSKK